MHFSYDPRYNIAYIRFRPKSKDVESLRISDEIVLDLAPDGQIYGIELLNANEQLESDESGRVFFCNSATGKEIELPLTG